MGGGNSIYTGFCSKIYRGRDSFNTSISIQPSEAQETKTRLEKIPLHF